MASIAPACAAIPLTFVRRLEAVAAELLKGNTHVEPGRRKLLETRNAVESGWQSIANLLAKNGDRDLASDVRQFVERFSAPLTEQEWIAAKLLGRARTFNRDKHVHRAR
jgi:hypothetical protein